MRWATYPEAVRETREKRPEYGDQVPLGRIFAFVLFLGSIFPSPFFLVVKSTTIHPRDYHHGGEVIY